MHLLFKVLLDKEDSLVYPNFEPEHIDLFLNRAYERFIKQRSNGNNPARASFEETQKRIDDLDGLVKTPTAITAVATSDPSIYTIPLPSDYRQLERLQITGTGIKAGTTPTTFKLRAKQAKNDQIETGLEDPFNKPNKDEVFYLREGNNIKVIADGSTTINSGTLTYIKNPLTLSIAATGVNAPTGFTNTPEVRAHTHTEIVDMAVLMAIENIESPRYQTNTIETNKQE